LARFERHAPASVMARLALEHTLPADWVDAVFEAHRQRQYSRELLFSTVVGLTLLVSLGLRPSLHAAARQMPKLPVSLASLYDKVNHTEPAILRALVHGSARRLASVMTTLQTRPHLPGWQVRILDGNHLPASEKRLAPLRGSGARRCRASHWWCMIQTLAGSRMWWPARTRTRSSVLRSRRCWTARSRANCGSPTVTSAPARCCGLGRTQAPASSCASTPATTPALPD
jgi:hypothetical protein